MCDTLQLNWKLPTTPIEAISSPLSSIRDSNVNFMLNNNVTSSSSNRNQETSINASVTNKKENLNISRTTSSRNKSTVKSYSNSAMLRNSKVKVSNRKTDGKYVLRECSVKKRNEVEVKKAQPKKRGPKPRPKPQPMSKYRRKTANLRERERMGEINNAFEHLKEKIPTPLVTADNNKSCNGNEKRNNRCEKMTKINVLHIAINYIRALESILDTGDAGTQVYGTSIVQSPRLSVPNSFVNKIEMMKENRNESNEINNENGSPNHNSMTNKAQQLSKNIQGSAKYKKRAKKVISSPKCGLLKGKQNKVTAKTVHRMKEKNNSNKEVLFNANITEQLNQLKPVMPPNFLEASSNQKNHIVNSTSNEDQHVHVKEEDDNELSNSYKYCPDWTELTPTLEFPDVASNLEEQKLASALEGTSKTDEGFQHIQPLQNPTNEFNSPNSSMEASKPEALHSKPFSTQALPNSLGTSNVALNTKSYTSLPDSPQPRGNLDTLLSSAASNVKQLQEKDISLAKMNHDLPNSYAQRKLKTVPKAGVNVLNCDLVFKSSLPWLTNSPSPPIFGRQPSFPDVFGASDDPDFLFDELTKATFTGDESIMSDQDLDKSYSTSYLGHYPKTYSMSSGNGSILSSDGSASSPEESDTTIMDYIDDSFQISI